MPIRFDVPPTSEITPPELYTSRRDFLKLGAAGALGLSAFRPSRALADDKGPTGAALPNVQKSPLGTTGEELTSFYDVTHYNNFYELGTAKDDPADNAAQLKPRPWSVHFEGEIARAQTVDIDTLMKWFPLEERVYRMRCVEAWSMVIPWVGIPLAALLKRLEPTSRAKYVVFESIDDPQMLPGQKRAVLEWPYVEGLRIDEAMHPLTILAVGLYGRVLPNQNGAPLRLVVPWKYGFKGAKSLVRIKLTEQKPRTTWAAMNPGEYGFYANVNPEVDHPRWSQAKERRIGDFFKRKTLPFNGYGEQVAQLYAGLDPKTLY